MQNTFKYPFERGGKNRIELSVDSWLRNGVLKLDGSEIWRFSSEEEVRQGATLTLPDGSILEIQLRLGPNGRSPLMYIARDGEPLPKSPFDHETDFRNLLNILRLYAGLYVIGGLLSLAGIDGFLTKWTGGSLYSLIAGVLLIGITFLPDDKKSVGFLAGLVIGIAEAVYFFTHPPFDEIGALLRVSAIIFPLVCLNSFGNAQRHIQERKARKAAKQ